MQAVQSSKRLVLAGIVQLLLPLLLRDSCICAARSFPIAYVCDRNQQFSIIQSAVSNAMRTRICLYNQNFRNHDRPVLLTNVTKSELIGNGLQHLTFAIPPDLLTCKFTYKWKVETYPTILGDAFPGGCFVITPYDECPIEIGRSTLCPGWSPYTLPLPCLVLPSNLTFLHEDCSPREPPPDPDPDPRIALAVSVSIGVTVLLAIVLLVYLRKRKSRSPEEDSPAPELEASRPPKSAFSLLGDGYQFRRFVSSTRDRPARELMALNGVSSGTYKHLLMNPDTGAPFSLENGHNSSG